MSGSLPTLGTRITLTYPAGWTNFPTRRCGTVDKYIDDSFVVLLSTEQRVIVNTENYRQHGADWRPWNPKDGWETNRLPRQKKNKK